MIHHRCAFHRSSGTVCRATHRTGHHLRKMGGTRHVIHKRRRKYISGRKAIETVCCCLSTLLCKPKSEHMRWLAKALQTALKKHRCCVRHLATEQSMLWQAFCYGMCFVCLFSFCRCSLRHSHERRTLLTSQLLHHCHKLDLEQVLYLVQHVVTQRAGNAPERELTFSTQQPNTSPAKT